MATSEAEFELSSGTLPLLTAAADGWAVELVTVTIIVLAWIETQ